MSYAGMPQLAGQPCTLCTKTIAGVTDGYYCEACGCPVHCRCAERADYRQPNICGSCGCPAAKGEARREQERRASAMIERDVHAEVGLRHLVMGVLWIGGGVGASIFCTGASGGSSIVVATGPVVVGILQLVYGVIQLKNAASGPPLDEPPPAQQSREQW